ncbi:cellulose synthase/poly-beta-1,6-N-acetylglucosamine synthase-like glycosyltransferase [Mucilaginibacter gracilis]|uniref:Cellulose synthase/poly-beta-1,6-N-acetylglucosamine synthase-like glycosyltransferase n=1 Tax=Mucilaginibacter gracilis TaxID=423350 RepID=A0A495JBP6_9SPHI|nr:glycosyltransferase family 2 protein [Mucilaginibacter gracilis]RKR85489.1 cellulose synthase/poly-beta-1,6-N-acetylglucosamine synthase-like glycosyltransferase [Mucilaginibacter gracilis]
MEIILWLSLFIVVYTFVGYGILLYIIIRIKRITKGKPSEIAVNTDMLPTCTLVVAAYNEEQYMADKIKNTLQLKYPAGKLKFLFVTDGSDDSTPDIIKQYPHIQLMHKAERSGKIMAIHRAMKTVNTDITVFTDANTFLNEDAIINICRHYADQTVGAIAGEKRVKVDENADASAAGEGFYWKYESALKKWDSELYSVVGAAGELFSVRTSLYKPVEDDTILDDFMISMLIAKQGYRIVYEPAAYATETSSANVTEELKRKVRIAAGGIQSIIRLKALLNPFNYPLLSFQYISHRVLRWTITPFLLILSFILNIALAFNGSTFYQLLLAAQILFYAMAILGWVMEKRELRIKVLFIPYYFCIMNYAVLAGIIRYSKKAQSATWEKAARKQ